MIEREETKRRKEEKRRLLQERRAAKQADGSYPHDDATAMSYGDMSGTSVGQAASLLLRLPTGKMGGEGGGIIRKKYKKRVELVEGGGGVPNKIKLKTHVKVKVRIRKPTGLDEDEEKPSAVGHGIKVRLKKQLVERAGRTKMGWMVQEDLGEEMYATLFRKKRAKMAGSRNVLVLKRQKKEEEEANELDEPEEATGKNVLVLKRKKEEAEPNVLVLKRKKKEDGEEGEEVDGPGKKRRRVDEEKPAAAEQDGR